MNRARTPSRAIAFRVSRVTYKRLAAASAARQMKVGTYVRRWVERAFATPAKTNM